MIRLGVTLLVFFLLTALGLAADSAPKWVTNPPAQEGNDAVFVASGTSAKGDRAEAEQAAWEAVTSQIMAYIGVKIDRKVQLDVKSSLDSYAEVFRKSVVTQSSNQVAGLRRGELFVQNSGTSVTVSLKALYNKNDIELEKKRVASLFRELNDAVDRPEREGDALAAEGKLYEAVGRFVEAARVSTHPALDNVEVRFERNLSKARQLVQALQFVPISGPTTAVVGADVDQPFVVKVGRGPAVDPVAGVMVLFTAQTIRGDRYGTQTATVLTDAQGLARFTVPKPAKAASLWVSAQLSTGTLLDPLFSLPGVNLDLVSALSGDFDEPQARWTYQAKMTSASPTAVAFDVNLALVNLDGSPRSSAETAAALRAAVVPKAPGTLKGLIRVVSLQSTEGLYSCRVEGTLNWVTGDKPAVWSLSRPGEGTGRDKDAAVAAALRAWIAQQSQALKEYFE